MSRKRKRKTDRRKRQHPVMGSVMSVDRRRARARRAPEIGGTWVALGPGDTCYPVADANLTEGE